MSKETADRLENESSLVQRLVEVALIFVLFFLFAGGEPPGVNESHYLCKAKHYWDRDWCRDDFFLNSADAHAVFYWTFGWITLPIVSSTPPSLEATAWMGRIVVWLLQAWAWRRLSWSLLPKAWFSLLSAAVFLTLLERGHMAGEWVVGDVEAKGIAYVLVFLGLEALVRGRWFWVFPAFGAAAAFHVIVGGWAVVAAGVAWLSVRGAGEGSASTGGKSPDPRSRFGLIASLAFGFALSLPGLIPCLLLDRGTSPEVVEQGNLAYVYARLGHHLVFHRFPLAYQLRFGALTLLAIALAVWLWRVPRLRRLYAFTGGALLLAVIGIVIDQSLLNAPETAARLLRYYWYRLSDPMVPLSLAMSLCYLAAGVDKPATAWRNWLLVGLMALGTWNIVDLKLRRAAQGVPEGELALQLRSGSVVSVAQRHHDWAVCCRWIRKSTDRNTAFLTPRGQQTFKWYAHRAEIVSWKDAPQDAASLVAWLKRYEDVHPRPGGTPILFGPEIDPNLPLEERLWRLAAKYDAQYVVVDRFEQSAPPQLPLVYPLGEEFNGSFAVYLLDKDSIASKPQVPQ